MNDLHHPCPRWAEPISLAAAGCLSADEERALRRHLQTCSACRERLGQLTRLCGLLAESRSPTDSAEAAVVQRVMAAITSGPAEPSLVREMPEIRASSPAETTRPTFLTRSHSTWRWIMHSRVSRVVAAAIFVLAVTGVALWFHGGGTTLAFADFLQPLLDAKTVKYKMTFEMAGASVAMAGMMGLPAETQKDLMNQTSVVMLPDANRSRTEMTTRSGKFTTVQIWDGRQQKTLILQPAQKQATVYNYPITPKPKTPQGKDRRGASPRRGPGEPWPVAFFRSLLRGARDKPDFKREPLGEKDIDGCHVVGFRVSLPDAVTVLWGDPKTGLPVRIESTAALVPDMKLTMSDFAFNVPMDESLFSVEPPAGYEVTQVQRSKSDDSPKAEKDLIELLRYYSEFCGGRFPDLLDMQWISEMVRLREWCLANFGLVDTSMAKRDEEGAKSQSKIQRGLQFTIRLPKEADAHYAGRCVSRGAAGTPIFWYRPKNATQYRVIYADLSVREVVAPPSVPVLTVAQRDNDLIEMFRQYSQSSGGSFPESLDVMQLLIVVMPKKDHSRYFSGAQKLSAKQEQQMAEEISQAEIKLQRGLMFVGLLPKEADSRYAGNGVSRGAAGTPIFWYRPKDSKTYRVVYADLSVRDAGTRPSVPVAPPEQALINTLRYYSEASGGPFPAALDLGLLLQMVEVKMPSFLAEGKFTAQQEQQITTAAIKFQPGLRFRDSLPPEADAHYAGKGVSRGAAGTPIFWYRPKGAKKYRVIYGDLSVRDADTPPRAPDPAQDLIDALRYCAELSGGPFPDSLDLTQSLEKVMVKKLGLKKDQHPNAKQVHEILEIQFKLQPGTMFVAALTPKADAHYAGKGVSLGAADQPIFWYRPTDAKKYRVIYADLSLRDAGTPPTVPHAQPVPGPSSSKVQRAPRPSSPKK